MKESETLRKKALGIKIGAIGFLLALGGFIVAFLGFREIGSYLIYLAFSVLMIGMFIHFWIMLSGYLKKDK